MKRCASVMARRRESSPDGRRLRAVRVVEAVAEGDHDAWLVAAEQQGEAVQCGVRVPRRQELAAARIGRALLQVQVGDREQPGGRPEQGAGRVEHQTLAGEMDRSGGHAVLRAVELQADEFELQGIERLRRIRLAEVADQEYLLARASRLVSLRVSKSISEIDET